MNYYKRILQAGIISCLSIPVLDALYKAPQIEFGKYHAFYGRKERSTSVTDQAIYFDFYARKYEE